MSEERLFQDADEQERLYAPEQLPEEQRRVRADEGTGPIDPDEPRAATPVANIGTTPSGMAALPNAGPRVEDGALDDIQSSQHRPEDTDE